MDLIKSLFAAVLSFILSAIPSVEFPSVPHSKDFELVWEEDFEGDELDTAVWDGHCFAGGSDSTFMRKGGYWNTDFVSVKNGNLHISTVYCPDGYRGNGLPGWYTCGIDTSRSFSQTYGYFECRCILPEGSGAWSAFWMFSHGVGSVGNGGADGAEIDVFESPNYNADKPLASRRVTSNIHYDGYGEDHKQKNVCQPYVFVNNPYKEFNTYGVEWNEKEYIFYINGIETGRTDFGVSQVPEWLILSVEVGGENGVAAESWAGPALDPQTEVTDFIVDYIRVYQYK